MSSLLMQLSFVLVKLAQTPYLDGYLSGAVAIIATIAVNALVIHCIYSIPEKMAARR
jgi:hypothetical protein